MLRTPWWPSLLLVLSCVDNGPPPADDDVEAETLCSDYADNDGDGRFDCADPDCDAIPPCSGDDDSSPDDDSVADDDSTPSDDDTAPDDDTAGDDDDGTPGEPITCSPAFSSVTASDAVPATVQLTATADLGNGPEPVGSVTWSVVQGAGTVSTGGLYTSPSDHGGSMLIEAERLQRTDTCAIDVEFDGIINQSGHPNVESAANSAGTSPTGCPAPTIVYPLSGSAMPGSFQAPVIQWNPGNGSQNVHGLTLTSSMTSVTVWTTATSYQPPDALWDAITLLDPANTVVIGLVSGQWSGSGFTGSLCAAPAVTVEVTDFSINGTVIYWAPPQTRMIDVEQVTNTSVPLQGFLCHGCHNVNLNNPMRMSYGPDFPGTTNVVDVSSPGTVIASMSGDIGALNPDGSRIAVGSLFGGLTLFNAATGASLGAISTPSGAATQPTWSPDGGTLVYASCDGAASALEAADCDLYRQTWNGSGFSGEALLAQAPAGATYYYPTFSPNSQWIAFNRAWPVTGSDGSENWSNNNPTADLMLVHVSGSPIIELDIANGTGDLTNSWPRWAPATGSYAWLAWATQRAYGNETDGISQIWVTAIDLGTASTGTDPSRPPVWLPGQLTNQGNHTPTWVPRLGP
jgi:hypothetical protein